MNKLMMFWLLELGFDEAFSLSGACLRILVRVLVFKNNILRNACTLASSNNSYLVAYLHSENKDNIVVDVTEQYVTPYAIFECKRVGVEEGMKKVRRQ